MCPVAPMTTAFMTVVPSQRTGCSKTAWSSCTRNCVADATMKQRRFSVVLLHEELRAREAPVPQLAPEPVALQEQEGLAVELGRAHARPARKRVPGRSPSAGSSPTARSRARTSSSTPGSSRGATPTPSAARTSTPPWSAWARATSTCCSSTSPTASTSPAGGPWGRQSRRAGSARSACPAPPPRRSARFSTGPHGPVPRLRANPLRGARTPLDE